MTTPSRSRPSRRAALQTGALGLAGLAAGPARADEGGASGPRIKVGQIGVGHPHASKLSVYRGSPDYEVVGVVEPDEGLRRAAENAPAYRGLTWLTREQLLATPGLQAVLVETRVADLLDNAEACVSAGMHVHIDKPPGDSLPRLRRLLEAAAARKLLVQPGYMFRFNPAVVLLREFLAKGWLGEVFEVHAVMSKVIDPPVRRELAAFRGGVMFELGCHVLDLVVGVLGRPTAVTGYHRHSSRLDDGLADNCLAVLEYPKATATVRSTAMEVQGFDRRHLTVVGTGGTFHIQPLDNPTAKVTLSQDRGGHRKGTREVRFPRYVRYVGDAADMAAVIRGRKASDFTAEHELAVQETLLKACGMTEK